MNWSIVVKLAKVSLAVIVPELGPGTAASIIARWLANMFDKIPVNAALDATAQHRGPVVHLGTLPPEPYTAENLVKWAKSQDGYVSESSNGNGMKS
jgi:hypothetical protein